jgi:hypothetical protein
MSLARRHSLVLLHSLLASRVQHGMYFNYSALEVLLLC